MALYRTHGHAQLIGLSILFLACCLALFQKEESGDVCLPFAVLKRGAISALMTPARPWQVYPI